MSRFNLEFWRFQGGDIADVRRSVGSDSLSTAGGAESDNCVQGFHIRFLKATPYMIGVAVLSFSGPTFSQPCSIAVRTLCTWMAEISGTQSITAKQPRSPNPRAYLRPERHTYYSGKMVRQIISLTALAVMAAFSSRRWPRIGQLQISSITQRKMNHVLFTTLASIQTRSHGELY